MQIYFILWRFLQMKKKKILDLVMPIGLILAGIACIIFAIEALTGVWFEQVAFGANWVDYKYYGGDAYTGIQQAVADTANNVLLLHYNFSQFIQDMNGFFVAFGAMFLVAGIIIILIGTNKTIKVFTNKESIQAVDLINKEDSTKNN